MKLATTTGTVSHDVKEYEKRIRSIQKAGFRCIDLNFYNHDCAESLLLRDDRNDFISRLKAIGDELGISYVQAHTPGSHGNPMIYDENREYLISSTKRCIEACAALGIKNAVIHTGWKEGVGKEEYFRENLKFLKEFFPVAEKCGVNLLIENSTKVNMVNKYFFFEGSEMREFIEYANHPNLFACWDTGHAHIEGHQYKDLVDLGDLLKAMHIHDNYADCDRHMPLYSGTINMDEIMHGLADSGYTGYFTFECDNLFKRIMPPWEIRKKYPADDRLYKTPDIIFECFDKLLYETGKYILEQYEIFEY